jgi:hypothetical protein
VSEVSTKVQAPSIGGWVHLDAHRWALGQMARTDVTPLAKLVLLAMASHIRDDRYEVWPSQERLAGLVGATRQGARLAIESLERAGLIAVTRPDGLRAPLTYRLRCEDSLQRCKVEPDPVVKNVAPKEPVLDLEPTYEIAREPAILTIFPIDGPGSSVGWPLTDALVAELSADFRTVDVLAECRKARAWVMASPERRKTAAGMRRFLTGWLSRAVDTRRVVPGGGHGPMTNGAQTLKRRIDASGGGDHLAEAMRRGMEDDGGL